MSDSVVIVGAGHAGTALAFRLRQLGFDGAVDLIGEEPDYPYQRPLLSKKYLLGEVDESGLHLKGPDQYREQEIRLRTGCSVIEVDAKSRLVRLADGAIVPYGYLVLATGCRPRVLNDDPAWQASNVQVLRNVHHARALQSSWRQGQHLLIVGGGYVGLEAAAVARALGMRVTLLERSPRILNRVACEATADLIRQLHVRNGVQILENTSLDGLDTGMHQDAVSGQPSMRAERARLDSGQVLDVDHILIGVGAVPEVSLAMAAGLLLNDGITTDVQTRTSDPNILAIGDCANLTWRGQRIRLESVPNANEMANVAAHTIVGNPQPYRGVPWFWSDQYELKLQIAGLNTGYTHTVVRRDGNARCAEAPAVSVWYFQGERLIALDALNDAKAFMLGRKWIEAGLSPCAADLGRAEETLQSLVLNPVQAVPASGVATIT